MYEENRKTHRSFRCKTRFHADCSPLLPRFAPETSLRLILGTVFLASSISKATQPRLFAITIAKFKLVPSTWSLSVSLTLIAIELLIAVSLFVGWRIRLIALLSGVLLLIFTIVIIASLLRGHTELDCGCFGRHSAQKDNRKLLIRNLILLIMATILTIWGSGLHTPDINRFLSNSLLIKESAPPFLLVCVGTWTLLLLTRQLYRLLMLTTLEE